MSRADKKAFRPLIIAGAALVLLGGALAALTLLPAPAAPSASPPPSATPAPAETLLNIPPDKPLSLSCVRADGTAFTVTRQPGGEQGAFTCALTPGFPGFSYRQDLLEGLASGVAALTGTPLLDAPTDSQLAAFGLDTPQAVWTIQSTQTNRLELGAKNALGDGYYARLDGQSRVVVLPLSAGDALSVTEPGLRQLKRLPVIDDKDVGKTIRSVKVDGAASFTLKVHALDEVSQGGAGSGVYRLSAPVDWETNDYYVTRQVITPLMDINPFAVVEDNPADPARYGLDKPDRLTVEGTDGTTVTLLIGAQDTATGGRYVMYEDVSSVLLDTAGTYLFLKTKPLDLMSRFLWLNNITTLTGVTLELPSGTRTLTFNQTGAGEALTMKPQFEGREITEDSAKHFYQGLLGLAISELIETPPPVKPDYTVTLHRTDGTRTVMTLTPYNERTYAASVDGSPAMYGVGVLDVKRMTDNLALLDEGQEVPSR